MLIDAATRHAGRRILRQLRGRTVNAHALTHAHPDHQGASKEVCEALGIPFWVGERDADAAESPELIGERQPDHPIAQFFERTMTGPGRRVDRMLREGDEVAGFQVLDTPGHSAGHVCFWRESDRVLDARRRAQQRGLAHRRCPGLREPKPFLTPDPAREPALDPQALAALEPRARRCSATAPPLRDTAKFVDFVEQLEIAIPLRGIATIPNRYIRRGMLSANLDPRGPAAGRAEPA